MSTYACIVCTNVLCIEISFQCLTSNGGQKVPVAQAAARACRPGGALSSVIVNGNLAILSNYIRVMPRLWKFSWFTTANQDQRQEPHAWS
jgi:hypothetical protein